MLILAQLLKALNSWWQSIYDQRHTYIEWMRYNSFSDSFNAFYIFITHIRVDYHISHIRYTYILCIVLLAIIQCEQQPASHTHTHTLPFTIYNDGSRLVSLHDICFELPSANKYFFYCRWWHCVYIFCWQIIIGCKWVR